MSHITPSIGKVATALGWDRAHTSTRQGVIAGAIAATCVAVCALIIDLIARQPFATASAWWDTVASLFDFGSWAQRPLVGYLGSIVIHYALFTALGKTAAVMVELGREDTAIRFIAAFGFVLAQLMFFSFVSVIHDLSLGSVTTCVQLIAASVVGSASMAAWLLRHRFHFPPLPPLRRSRRSARRPLHDRLTTRSEY